MKTVLYIISSFVVLIAKSQSVSEKKYIDSIFSTFDVVADSNSYTEDFNYFIPEVLPELKTNKDSLFSIYGAFTSSKSNVNHKRILMTYLISEDGSIKNIEIFSSSNNVHLDSIAYEIIESLEYIPTTEFGDKNPVDRRLILPIYFPDSASN